MNSKKWYKAILNQLDEAYINYDFPIFNNSNYPAAAMKVYTYRDDAEWIIAFDRIVYGISDRSFLNFITAFGNKLFKQGYQTDIEIITSHKKYPIWDEDYNYILNDRKFKINIKGKETEIDLTDADYEKSHVNERPDMYPGLKLLRLIVPKVEDKIWFTESEILEKINRANIPLFLKLEQWNHPDILEKPSENKCFDSLAQALASGDKTLYKCSEPINSFWYCWDE